MRFAIRDDDVNFYTEPDELLSAYQATWEICSPTFSAITHVKGNWKHWVNEIYKNKHEIDWAAWKHDDQIFPLHENGALIKFLKQLLKEKKIGLSLHAIHHRNEDPIPPKTRNNNYVLGAEFLTSRNLTTPLRKAKKYLEETIGAEITVFTPPQNLMSIEGYQAVLSNNLSIVGSGIAFWKKEKTIKGMLNIAKIISFKLRHTSEDYPFVLHYKSHTEAPHHYPLQPTTHLKDLITTFEKIRNRNGDFILSTHYTEFETPLTYDPTKKMKDVFNSFIKYSSQYPYIKYVTLDEMLSSRKLQRE